MSLSPGRSRPTAADPEQFEPLHSVSAAKLFNRRLVSGELNDHFSSPFLRLLPRLASWTRIVASRYTDFDLLLTERDRQSRFQFTR